MKKIYLIIYLTVCCALTGYSQPIFNSSSFAPAGTNVTTYGVNPAGISPGPAGANQTWNFSAYPPDGTSSTTMNVTPASTPYAATFPAATVAARTVNGLGNDAYVYFVVNASYADMIGFAVVSTPPSPDIVFNYSNTRRLANFPFTYNSVVNDTYTAFASYVANGLTVMTYRRGTLNLLADGYGTVITPGGTFTNSLRTRSKEIINDSTVITGFPVASLNVYTYHIYSWSEPGLFQPAYSVSYDTIQQNGVPSTNLSAFYANTTTGINAASADHKSMEIYPNPAFNANTVHVQADGFDAGAARFVVTDLHGREVKNIPFALMPANHKSVSIEVSDLPAGIYMFRLEQKNIIYTAKFIRQ